ncbi:MAG: exo-alpha-sialidase [Actinobacteria bacterium]|nr:exo-alpha-sialidase [Actinomycetota bacterium]MBA3737928.1 exo-alpha-sialidase [Actinomycetota bacterium]
MGRPVILVTAAALLLFVGAAGAARVTGTPRADFLRGGPRADVLDGRGGSDRIKVEGGGRDRVQCGKGSYDLVNADLSDRVAGDCETVARVVARDPYRTPAQHATIAEPDSFAWGNTVVTAFQSGRFRDGAAVNTGWATSRDGGRTWRSGTLPSLTVSSRPAGRWQRASDPVVAYDAAHGVWLIASLALTAGDAAAVVVNRSSDGLTWSAPVTVVEAPWEPNLLLDKEWIVCDNGAASTHRGSCYATYSDFRTFRLEFQASRDGGLTWGPQVSAPENAGRASIVGRWAPAPQPVVQPDGDLIVPYYDEDRVASVRSVDGGRSFERPVTVSPTRFRATPGLRAPPLPSAEVDVNGVVYVVWPDCRSRPSCRFDDLVISRSVDGNAWSTPTRIPIAPRSSQADFVIPGIGVDATGAGRLAVTYYVLRGGQYLDAGFISSEDGGRSWRPPRRLNAQTMQLDWVAQAGGAMVGDYISTSWSGGRAVAVFVLANRPRQRFDQPLFAASIRP